MPSVSLSILLALVLTGAAVSQGTIAAPAESPVGVSTGAAAVSPQTSQPKDSTSQRPQSRADSVLVVKHQFNHREQIIAGSVIMACLAGILVVMNNYNPR